MVCPVLRAVVHALRRYPWLDWCATLIPPPFFVSLQDFAVAEHHGHQPERPQESARDVQEEVEGTTPRLQLSRFLGFACEYAAAASCFLADFGGFSSAY